MLSEDGALVSQKRFPKRSLRPELIDDLIKGWRETLPVTYSLDFAVSRTKHGCCITERRICAADILDEDDPEVDRVVVVGEIGLVSTEITYISSISPWPHSHCAPWRRISAGATTMPG